MKTSSQIHVPGLTSFLSALTAKKSMKIKFSADKINYIQFFSRESKDYKCLRNIFGVRGTLKQLYMSTVRLTLFLELKIRP